MTRVLIAGGGVAAIEAMLALHALAEDRVEIELLGPEPHFWYRPLSVVEPFGAPKAARSASSGMTSRSSPPVPFRGVPFRERWRSGALRTTRSSAVYCSLSEPGQPGVSHLRSRVALAGRCRCTSLRC